jgi:hypothetical protein
MLFALRRCAGLGSGLRREGLSAPSGRNVLSRFAAMGGGTRVVLEVLGVTRTQLGRLYRIGCCSGERRLTGPCTRGRARSKGSS